MLQKSGKNKGHSMLFGSATNLENAKKKCLWQMPNRGKNHGFLYLITYSHFEYIRSTQKCISSWNILVKFRLWLNIYASYVLKSAGIKEIKNKDGIFFKVEDSRLRPQDYEREIKGEVILEMRRKKIKSSVLITIFVFLYKNHRAFTILQQLPHNW